MKTAALNGLVQTQINQCVKFSKQNSNQNEALFLVFYSLTSIMIVEFLPAFQLCTFWIY